MEYIKENWWYILLLVGFGYMMFKRGGCCGGGHSKGEHDHNKDNGQHGSGQVNNTIDMVIDRECGMYINPETAIKQNVDGKTYYFCSENCKNSFEKKHL